MQSRLCTKAMPGQLWPTADCSTPSVLDVLWYTLCRVESLHPCHPRSDYAPYSAGWARGSSICTGLAEARSLKEQLQQMNTQPFFDIYATLPAGVQVRLQAEATQVQSALDRAIMAILQPTVARSADSFLVRDEIIPLYGIGQTPQAAMDDYRSVVVEYYESLEADADQIAESLQVQLGILRRVFALLEPLH